MQESVSKETRAPKPSFVDLFTPKLVTVLKEGYGLPMLRADIVAALTVAIVALPLSMAIAIASGTTPARGLYTAVIGGFLVSALGGSRFQIGGPAGAFIVLVAATVQQHGLDGLLLATFLSGVMLVLIGYLRLGTYIKFIPYPVTVGFTAGIAVIIFASQIKPLLGLTLDGGEPGPFVDKLVALWAAIDSFNTMSLAIAGLTIAVILVLKYLRPGWPGMLIGVGIASLVSGLMSLPVETIGTAFGGIPTGFPLPSLPDFSPEKVVAILPNAVSFAILGSIESLLSAVVADGMTNRRHRSNCELVAQGVANMGSALFGGICVTGTIARTATNVRAGAHGPLSGMMHAIFVLAFILVAAPLAQYIPLSALAGILAVVAWNMIEKHAFLALLKSSKGDALVLLATFLLTVFRSLTEGIIVGFALGAILFIDRMAKSLSIESREAIKGGFVLEDQADEEGEGRVPYDSHLASDPDMVIYHISGAFFFGAASTVGSVLDRIADRRRTFILDFHAVPFLDSTGANVLEGAVRKAAHKGVQVVVTGASPVTVRMLQTHGVRAPEVMFYADVDQAIEALKADKGSPSG
ncbi:SulP family inorganic anion transporter [Aestuariispira ectoiniformans]|uniref:SulP family inorganic anion transporter n=1 Tax=Aestuariispira ectoiniformans TaxID=2775080 RepID=UPI00223BD007|nr:SulP family inorganic anion transporter [Aestuariispira ectoiniformans]